MSALVRSFKELHTYRDLIFTWVIREIKIRYKQSILGGLWAILQPLSVAIIFSFIFTRFIPINTDGVPHIIFYYSALLPWVFFSNSVSQGANSLISNLNLVTKIYFPREILPLATIFAALLDFIIALFVYFGLALIYKIPFGSNIILLPVLIMIQILFTIPIVLSLAALNVFFRDIRFVVPLGLQLFMYSIPLIYPVSVIPTRYLSLYLLNPMASLIQAYRSILVYNTWPNFLGLMTSLGVSIVIFIISYTLFIKASKSFADLI